MDQIRNGLLDEDNSKLVRLTRLQVIVDHLIWFTEHPSISKDAFSDMLHIQHFSTLPKTFASKFIQ